MRCASGCADVTPVSLEGFSREQVAKVMNAVDVTLMTSDFEGSPVAVKESLACMTPVVSVPVGDLPELLEGLPGCAIVAARSGRARRRDAHAFESGGDPAAARAGRAGLAPASRRTDGRPLRERACEDRRLKPMRRLCMVVTALIQLARAGWPSEARAALDAGWEVDVVATRNPRRADRGDRGRRCRVSAALAHEWGGGAFDVAREYLGFTLLATAKVAALMKRRRYSVVQVHNPPDFLVLAALAPRLLGARVIFDIHDFAPELFAMRFAIAARLCNGERAHAGVERLAIRFATAIVTVHEPYRRALEARGVPAEKITIVHNSLDERLVPAGCPAAESGKQLSRRLPRHNHAALWAGTVD